MIGGNDSIMMAVIVIIVIVALFWMIKPSKKSGATGNTKEKYNAGNNIDFRYTETDRNLPPDVMPHTDVPNVGSPFIIIDNS
jgi:hypothetical protein